MKSSSCDEPKPLAEAIALLVDDTKGVAVRGIAMIATRSEDDGGVQGRGEVMPMHGIRGCSRPRRRWSSTCGMAVDNSPASASRLLSHLGDAQGSRQCLFARGLGDASYSLRTLQPEPRTGLSTLDLHLANVCGKHSRVLLPQTSPALPILCLFLYDFQATYAYVRTLSRHQAKYAALPASL